VVGVAGQPPIATVPDAPVYQNSASQAPKSSGRRDVATQTVPPPTDHCSPTNVSPFRSTAAQTDDEYTVPMKDAVIINRVSIALQGDAVEIQADLDGYRTTVLLDSGSDVSCISTEYMAQIDSCRTLLPSVVTHGVTANDTALKFEGRVPIDISIDGISVEHMFYVCSGLSSKCLLGKDFMQAHKGVLDFDNNEFTFDESTTVPKIHTVSVAERTTIPRNSECDVICRIPHSKTVIGTVMFEPADDLPGDLFAGSSISKLDKDSRLLYVRFMNSTDYDILLKRGVPVGNVRRVLPKHIQQIREPKARDVPVTENTEQKKPYKFPDYDKSVLNEEQKVRMEKLFDDYRDIFSQGSHDIGKTNVVEHSIDTGDRDPIKAMPRRVPMHRRETLDRMIDEMQENDVIRKSDSPWASPIVLAPKKDGTLRFCVDFRALNEITRRDAYPLPRIDDILESLQGAQYYCHLDLASGYWQVRMSETDIGKTAFCVPGGLYEFLVMPFGLTNAPPTFQR
jgi:hypothetical protein